jgi:hypothetical protein
MSGLMVDYSTAVIFKVSTDLRLIFHLHVFFNKLGVK